MTFVNVILNMFIREISEDMFFYDSFRKSGKRCNIAQSLQHIHYNERLKLKSSAVKVTVLTFQRSFAIMPSKNFDTTNFSILLP